ncbi:MAG: hypothetical protein M3Y93_06185 [Pseudomonadota bacterium]|nr:hypothetical protein [Pseudomonadota bacterium]
MPKDQATVGLRTTLLAVCWMVDAVRLAHQRFRLGEPLARHREYQYTFDAEVGQDLAGDVSIGGQPDFFADGDISHRLSRFA